jgi:hypothetical protein
MMAVYKDIGAGLKVLDTATSIELIDKIPFECFYIKTYYPEKKLTLQTYWYNRLIRNHDFSITISFTDENAGRQYLKILRQSSFDKDEGVDYAIVDTVSIFRNLRSEFCRCTSAVLETQKSSDAVDTCFNAIFPKYIEKFRKMGFDTATKRGQSKMKSEIYDKLYSSCPALESRAQREFDEEEAKKLYFTGQLISQKQLPSGLYEVVLKDSVSSETRTFLAKRQIDDSFFKKNCQPGYELKIEYEVVKNNTSQDDEYHIKEFGTMTSENCILKEVK